MEVKLEGFEGEQMDRDSVPREGDEQKQVEILGRFAFKGDARVPRNDVDTYGNCAKSRIETSPPESRGG